MKTFEFATLIRNCLCVSLAFAGGASLAEDSLFSGGSLVDRTEKRPTESVSPLEPGRIGTPPATIDESTLDLQLGEAGFSIRTADGDRLVEMTAGGKTIAVQVALENERLLFAARLAALPNPSELSANQTRKMLAVNAAIAPAYFVVNATDKRLELRSSVRNVGLTAELLKAEIDHLSKVAAATTALWNAGSPVAESPTTPATPADPPAAAPAQPQKRTLNLVGRWVTELQQGGGFVLKLEKSREFVLGHVKSDGNVDRSEGSFALENGQLVLNGKDGSKLAGKIVGIDENSFRFTTGDGEGLVFERK